MDADLTQSATPHGRDSRDALRPNDVPPAEVPGYDLQRRLGTGAYGEVWVAADRNTGRQVAIKFFAHRGGVDWGLVSREVEKLVFLSADRYVVQLLEVGWDATPAYFVMEYVENGSLDDLLRAEGSLPVAQAVELFRELAIGLSRAHGKGVLHCDLKPANILLDQDHKPRLADFGQSRLVSEQSPALGTLFYMAPEQAKLDAVPDAQWDVYGLGALLYCLLTGAPPYRNEHSVTRLDSARSLEERLQRYRELIDRSPPPSGHRDVPGMDRALIEILDRCLSKRPQDRFHHVPAVLDALRQRDYMRMRRPLLLLGIVGPVLLLLTMSIFGYRGYHRAMRDSELEVTRLAMVGNEFAAELVADNVGHSIEHRFRAVGQVAEDPELLEALRTVVENPECREILEPLLQSQDGASSDDQRPEQDAMRRQFVGHPARQRLQQFVEQRLKDHSLWSPASVFVTDAEGTFMAAAFDGGLADLPIGKNFAYRSYFHGGPVDLPRGTRTNSTLTHPQLSSVFRSTSTTTWKVAISAPILAEGEFLGVIAMTVELGDFHDFRQDANRFAVVVDGRAGPHRGAILEHPVLEDSAARFDFGKYKADVDQLRKHSRLVYRDPLAKSPVGDAFEGDWIAGTSPVRIDARNGQGAWEEVDTGLVVVVQERLRTAVDPVARLGKRLTREATLAFTFVATVSLGLWYLVARSLVESKRSLRARHVDGFGSSTLHSRETLAQPAERPRS